jgi:hypothetical protein
VINEGLSANGVKNVLHATPSGVARQYLLFVWSGLALLLFELAQNLDGCDIVGDLCFFAVGD